MQVYSIKTLKFSTILKVRGDNFANSRPNNAEDIFKCLSNTIENLDFL